jgi:hypothetical protein
VTLASASVQVSSGVCHDPAVATESRSLRASMRAKPLPSRARPRLREVIGRKAVVTHFALRPGLAPVRGQPAGRGGRHRDTNGGKGPAEPRPRWTTDTDWPTSGPGHTNAGHRGGTTGGCRGRTGSRGGTASRRREARAFRQLGELRRLRNSSI